MRVTWFTWKDRSNPLAGGAEVVNEELARRLASDGHDVTFIVAGFRGGAANDERHGFRIIRVGSRVTVYLAAWRYYRRHRAELAPDLVIDECNTIPFFAGWYSGVPTVMLFHMLCRTIWFYQLPLPLGLIGWLIEPIYLRLLRRSPVVTVSESTQRDLLRQGFRSDDIHIISEGVEMAPVANLAISHKYPVPTVLSLGAFRAMKRTLDQIRAFEIAKRDRPDLRLVIAGDSSGRYGRRVLKHISRSPYAADIHYVGRVNAATRLELMRRSHAVLATGVKEGWCLVVSEAASQGTPAVVYDVDGLRDSVRTGQTGLITPVNTPAALADSLNNLLDDPQEYRRLHHAAWQWSRQLTFDRSYTDLKQALGLDVS